MDDDILFFDEDSSNVIFSSDEMGIVSVNLNNINLHDANFYKYDCKTIIHGRPSDWCYRYKQRKAFFFKKKLRINACCMASNKIVILELARRSEKRNRTIFY